MSEIREAAQFGRAGCRLRGVWKAALPDRSAAVLTHAAPGDCPVITEPLCARLPGRLDVGPLGGSSNNRSVMPPQAAEGTHDMLSECNGVNEPYRPLINFGDLEKR
jgi:hypothetical protein